MKTWKRVFTIPAYLIQEMSDKGMWESYEGKKCIESDDLRISFELSGGHSFLIPCSSRIILNTNGDVEIETLHDEVNET
jgi:hypothetical protein